jgi:signal transduction histidine kinase
MTDAPGVTEVGESAQILAFIRELSECNDSREIACVATRGFATLFGDYAVYGLVLSDREMHEWRLLPFANPKNPDLELVLASALPPETDLDALADEHGRNVSHAMEECVQLREDMNGEDLGILVTSNSPLWPEIEGLLPYRLTSVMAASWRRPLGGRGALFLGYRDAKPDVAQLQLFTLAVRLTARLSIYPGYAHLVARIEQVSHSLRRNIVHDLKTPVTVIRGYADTLLTPGMADDAELREEMLHGIAEQTERLLDDLKDILVPLDETWRPQLDLFDLSPLIEKAVVAERHTSRAALHKFEVEGTEQPCHIRADRRKIRRVVENLLSNAVKYSPGSGKVVAVNVERNGGEIRIVFRDQGIGMTERQLEHVLSGSGRVVDEALGIEGSGFGLDSCRRVLEAHGGSLLASSEIGVGSTFTAILPSR